MNKILKVIGIVLVVAGACLGAFTGIAVADYIGIAVAMIGAALTIVSTYRSTTKKDWKTILSIILIGIGAFVCGLAGLSEAVVTEVITAVIGVVVLITGILVPVITNIKAKSETTAETETNTATE